MLSKNSDPAPSKKRVFLFAGNRGFNEFANFQIFAPGYITYPLSNDQSTIFMDIY